MRSHDNHVRAPALRLVHNGIGDTAAEVLHQQRLRPRAQAARTAFDLSQRRAAGALERIQNRPDARACFRYAEDRVLLDHVKQQQLRARILRELDSLRQSPHRSGAAVNRNQNSPVAHRAPPVSRE